MTAILPATLLSNLVKKIQQKPRSRIEAAMPQPVVKGRKRSKHSLQYHAILDRERKNLRKSIRKTNPIFLDICSHFELDPQLLATKIEPIFEYRDLGEPSPCMRFLHRFELDAYVVRIDREPRGFLGIRVRKGVLEIELVTAQYILKAERGCGWIRIPNVQVPETIRSGAVGKYSVGKIVAQNFIMNPDYIFRDAINGINHANVQFSCKAVPFSIDPKIVDCPGSLFSCEQNVQSWNF